MSPAIKKWLKPESLAKICLLLAIFFLSLRLGGTLDQPTIKPSEIFILAALILTTVAIATGKLKIDPDGKKELRRIGWWLAAFLTTLAVGTTISFIKFRSLPFRFIDLEYIRIAVSIVFFLLVFIHGRKNSEFLRAAFFSFFSALGTAPFILMPEVQKRLSMLEPGGRFRGFFSDPNYFANFTLITVIFIVSMLLFAKLKRYAYPILYILAVMALHLIILSGSRSTAIGFIAASIVLLLSAIRYASDRKKIRAAIVALTIIASITAAAIMLVPQSKQPVLFYRAIPPPAATGSSYTRYILNQGQDRWSLARQSLKYITSNPLGFGPAYFKVIDLHNSVSGHVLVHNLILETTFEGGIAGLALLIMAVFVLARYFVRIKKPDFITIGFAAAFFGSFAGALFLDALDLRWLWALAALIMASKTERVKPISR